MPASAMSGRLTLSDPLVKELAQASCAHENYYDTLPKLQGEANWQQWSDALQHAALMAGTDTVLNGEAKHPQSLEGKQCTTIEWNDNIKRTAIWRSRNESLLKAMRSAADIDFTDFGASNAHDTYVSLRSRYHASDNQQAFRLFDENLVVGFELDASPREIANQLQDALNQYNQLTGDNIEQRLPENLLKMAFLGSLNAAYGGWRKALLRERNVLALGQGSAMTFNELVDLVVVEQAKLLQEQARMTAPVPLPPPQQAPKRDISQVDEPSQPALHRSCSLPHHSSSKHTNQTCETQNPRLRKPNWTATTEDQVFLAESPEVEESQLSNVLEVNQSLNLGPRRTCSLRHHQSAKHTNETCKTQNPQLRKPNWKPNKEDEKYLAEHPEIEKFQVSNASQVDKFSQPDPHAPCSLPHHNKGKHTNGNCRTQNPRLRQIHWKPSKADQVYLAEHPEIEKSQLGSDASPETGSECDSEDDSESGSEIDPESDFESVVESDPEDKYESRQETFANERGDNSASDQDGTSEEQNNHDEVSECDSTADEAWKRFAIARYAEVQKQIDLVTQATGARRGSRKMLLGDLSGKWMLYDQEHVSSTVDYYRIQIWETTTETQKQLHPTTQIYQGALTIGAHGHSETFRISSFSPSRHVSTRPTPIRYRRPGGGSYKGSMTFWGNGKMLAAIPPPVLGVMDRSVSWFEFAGIRSSSVVKSPGAGNQANAGNHNENDDHRASTGAQSHPDKRLQHKDRSGATVGFDRVIRTTQSTSVPIKVEEEDSDMIIDDEVQDSTAMAIKTEESEPSDSEDGWADDVATVMSTVQKRKDALREGLVVRLHDLSGMWNFYSPDYKQEPGQHIRISFYDRMEHGPAERMCAPGHCKPNTEQIHYCGELRFKAKEGERDWSCLIKQFDVPKQASVVPVKIQSWDPLSKRVIFITAWFLGGGAMSMSIPTTYIPKYQGQKTLITFSGVKRA